MKRKAFDWENNVTNLQFNFKLFLIKLEMESKRSVLGVYLLFLYF